MKEHNFKIVNSDTDSCSFNKVDGSPFSEQEMVDLIDEINELMPDGIEYEDDGYFSKLLVLKAKNYCLIEKEGDKIKKKGSSIIDSKKEVALSEMLGECIEDIMNNNSDSLVDIYNKYMKEAYNVTDISRWCTKKTITANVIKGTRINETKVMDAMEGEDFQEGDKVFIFADIDGVKQKKVKGELVFSKRTGEPKMIPNDILRLDKHFTGSYNKLHYVKRVRKTMMILQTVVDMERFINYSLVKNQPLLEEL